MCEPFVVCFSVFLPLFYGFVPLVFFPFLAVSIVICNNGRSFVSSVGTKDVEKIQEGEKSPIQICGGGWSKNRRRQRE